MSNDIIFVCNQRLEMIIFWFVPKEYRDLIIFQYKNWLRTYYICIYFGLQTIFYSYVTNECTIVLLYATNEKETLYSCTTIKYRQYYICIDLISTDNIVLFMYLIWHKNVIVVCD